jgi:hypothetical protein
VLQAICCLLARSKCFRPEREWPGGDYTHCRLSFKTRLFAFHDETFCLAVSFSGQKQGFQRGPMPTDVARGPMLHPFHKPMQSDRASRPQQMPLPCGKSHL